MEDLLKQIEGIERRYKELHEIFSKSKLSGEELRKYAKEYSSLEKELPRIQEYRKALREIEEAGTLFSTAKEGEMRELASQELQDLEKTRDKIEDEIRLSLSSPEGLDRNIFMEIRAGAGGGEAALFVSDLFRMYLKYIECKGWKSEVASSNPTGIGGFKEIIFRVEGKNAYGMLRHESGVHRVQRVPATEAGGRIHTSTATVAVLPEAEEIEVDIRTEDLRIDTFRSSGPGGQHMQKTDSAVRITHVSTGIVASCQEERSQQKNRSRAMAVLRARLLSMKEQEQMEEVSRDRKKQVGTADRSEKIRTYNYPQNRVTDHRINLALYRLPEILDGDLDEFVAALSRKIG